MKDRVVVACCLSLMLLSAACGGAEDGSSPPDDPTPEAASSPEEEPEEEALPVAEGEVTVTGSEWNFDAPEAAVAGPLEVTFENTGELTHELVVARLGEGPPLAEIARLETRKDILKEIDVLADTGRVFTGESSKPMKVKLKPGRYAFLCLLESPRGRTHAWVGMFHEVTVE